MKIEEKIQRLRKEKGWSQEELAFRLDVSRQSVSKWEMGTAVPDVDKILKMSELFGVSTDYLLKDSNERVTEKTENKKRFVDEEECETYLQTVQSTAWKIALGVALCVLSPITLFILLAVAKGSSAFSENVATGIGVGTLLAFVAVGVLLFVTCGAKLSRFEYLEKEEIQLAPSFAERVKREKVEKNKRTALCIAIGVSLCVLASVPLIITGCLDCSDSAQMYSLVALLTSVAIGVFLFVWSGCLHGGYEKLLQESDYSVENKRKNKRLETLGTVYWTLATAVYLLISFLSGRWDRTWIVWPVAGVAFAAIRQIVWSNIRKNKK